MLQILSTTNLPKTTYVLEFVSQLSQITLIVHLEVITPWLISESWRMYHCIVFLSNGTLIAPNGYNPDISDWTIKHQTITADARKGTAKQQNS